MSSMHPVPYMSNGGGMGNGIMDSGTINPAALDSAGLTGPSPHPVTQQPSRGIKRSHSEDDNYGDVQHGDDDDESKPRKAPRRGPGRPPANNHKPFDSPHQASQLPPTPSSHTSGAPPVQTPQLQNSQLPQASPKQRSPAKPTPTKTLKALPTVRDHTTDQLNPEGDEYIPRERDEAGEQKVTALGNLLGGRSYRVRTFFVPNRGDKLFMLATECARTLGYRDSYLLFNKNRSLFKIIATQAEKDDLIHQEVLPYSYRSRQIAIVTARSMFRQFGSRIITDGRRVRDDYWEGKARKQGFTEEDAAGEKRPGAAKQRAAAAEANAPTQQYAYPPAAIYGGRLDQDYPGGANNPLQPFGGVTPAPNSMPVGTIEPYNQRNSVDVHSRDYSSVQRPRQEVSGVPYQDLTRPTPSGEIVNQAQQCVDVQKNLSMQMKNRGDYLQGVWSRPHHPSQPQGTTTTEGESAPQVTQAVQSPHLPPSNPVGSTGQFGVVAGTPQRTNQNMTPQPYRQQSIPQNTMVPMAPQHTPLRQDQLHRRPPSMGMPPQGMPQGLPSGGMMPNVALGQTPGHGYPQSHMWSQGPPQPSPLSQQHNIPQQYAQRPPQQSPHPQPSPMHASPQLHHVQSNASMHGTPVQQFQTMGAMDPTYQQSMGQTPYQPNASPHQFMQHPNTNAQQPGMPGWAGGAQGNPQWGSY